MVGNGPSLNNINLELLNDYISIGCNSLYVGLIEKNVKFIPTILCSGGRTTGKYILDEYYNYISNKNNESIIMIHPSYLYHFNKNQVYDKGYKNLYYFSNLSNFELTKNINIVDKNIMAQNINVYSSKYKNVVSMISLLIAEKLGFKEIYMIGVDYNKNRLDHYYIENNKTKEGRYFSEQMEKNIIDLNMVGFKLRYNEFKNKNINLYLENKDSEINFIPYFNIYNLYK